MIYVDDLLITNKDVQAIDEVIKQLNMTFKVKVIGEPARFLGCALSRNKDNSITVSQQAYIDDILKEYSMSNCNRAATPMLPGYRRQRVALSNQNDAEAERNDDAEPISYNMLMGQLNWLVVKSRPDIQYPVFRLQRYMHQPLQYDVKAAKRILRYLRGSAYNLVLGCKPEKAESIFVDAAFQDHETGHSTTGFIIFYAGAPISWSSKKQTIITPSSTIAELVAFDEAVKEALYIRKLAIALGLRDNAKPLRINTDSANAIKLLQKPGFSSNKTVRWIENRYFFVHDELQKKSIEFNHVEGTNNVADGFTKPLDGDAFQRYMASLNLDRAG